MGICKSCLWTPSKDERLTSLWSTPEPAVIDPARHHAIRSPLSISAMQWTQPNTQHAQRPLPERPWRHVAPRIKGKQSKRQGVPEWMQDVIMQQHTQQQQQPMGDLSSYAATTQPTTTHILSLPNHIITSLILPRVSNPKCVCSFLASCKAAYSLSSVHQQADWLAHQRPEEALQIAIQGQASQALLLELLRRGVLEACDATTKDRECYRLLVYASKAGHAHAVRKLLQQSGADPAAVSPEAWTLVSVDGFTPLMAASDCGHASVVAALLEDDRVRERIDQKDAVGGQTALHFAARKGRVCVVRALRQAGANVNTQDASGKTPLHWACIFNHPAVVDEHMQSRELNILVRDSWGRTALDCAYEGGRMRSADRLASRMWQR